MALIKVGEEEEEEEEEKKEEEEEEDEEEEEERVHGPRRPEAGRAQGGWHGVDRHKRAPDKNDHDFVGQESGDDDLNPN
ncbi:hypothetical protein SprV_0100453300 [Sparganum proliferum]